MTEKIIYDWWDHGVGKRLYAVSLEKMPTCILVRGKGSRNFDNMDTAARAGGRRGKPESNFRWLFHLLPLFIPETQPLYIIKDIQYTGAGKADSIQAFPIAGNCKIPENEYTFIEHLEKM